MNNKYLKEFISRVNATHDVAKESNNIFFQKYFSQSLIVKKLFNGKIIGNDIYVFFKKIDVKIDDLSVFQENEVKCFFEDLLFKVTSNNIKLYCSLNKRDKYTYSCILENEKIFRYVTHDKESFEVLFKTLMGNVVGKIDEDPKFLLLLLYTPSLQESYRHFLISNIEDEIIDYTDIFLLPKTYQDDVETEKDFGDLVCIELIKQNKLKKNWNNLIFLYNQIGPLDKEENGFFVKYVNTVLAEKFKFLMQSTIHVKLKTDAKKFLSFLFFNNNIQSVVLDLFVNFLNKNKVFFVPEVFLDVEEKEIEKDYKNWDFDKCIIILNCFLGMRFLGYEQYSLLICYLMKKNIYGILEKIDNLENDYDQLPHCICIYSSLLFHSVDYENQKKFFIEDEISYILMKIDLNLLTIVFTEWKFSLGDSSAQFKFFVNKILSYENVEYKIVEAIPEKSLAFLNGLIGVAEPKWMEKIIRKIDENGYLTNDLEKNSHIKRWCDSIYEYIGETKDENFRVKEKEVLKVLWEDIPQIRREMPNVYIIASDYNQLEKIKLFRDKVRQISIKYESKKQYLAFNSRHEMEKLINCLGVFADRCVILCAKNKEMKIYEQAKNGNKIAECGKLISVLMEKCKQYMDDVSSLYADVEKLVLS
jgi:hypothetical protein